MSKRKAPERDFEALHARTIELVAALVEIRSFARHLAWQVRTEAIGPLELAQGLEQIADWKSE